MDGRRYLACGWRSGAGSGQRKIERTRAHVSGDMLGASKRCLADGTCMISSHGSSQGVDTGGAIQPAKGVLWARGGRPASFILVECGSDTCVTWQRRPHIEHGQPSSSAGSIGADISISDWLAQPYSPFMGQRQV
ncbi:hypothetical protein AG1IA_05590 [Rhizoctonia solani AG-1 IA]|uniref:Uncharacterized protein n=1 Tax=Thanatephorus cucumeris (strain AG1-IA) TaxID=983506 RepID=L8WVK2_THACA|nr:hypothetical protein AG1IA_05590 [Rhizoctonia solani AG-1 IA]